MTAIWCKWCVLEGAGGSLFKIEECSPVRPDSMFVSVCKIGNFHTRDGYVEMGL